MSILVALIALSLLILIHELGHFLVAKAVGIKVLEFSMFMGPKLLSFKIGETTYSLRLIPMGGYVKMEGEDESSNDPRAFSRQPVGKRACVIAAGPIMNLLAAFIFAVIVMTSSGFYTHKVVKFADDSVLKAVGMEEGDAFLSYGGKRIYDWASDYTVFMYGEDGKEKEIVYFDASENKNVTKIITPGKTKTQYRLGFSSSGSNVIEMVEQNSPLAKAGVKKGDKVIRLDDTEVSDTNEIITYLNETRADKTAPISVTIDRNGEIFTIENITPFADSRYTLGVALEFKKGSFGEVVKASWNYCVSTARNVLMTLGWLFNGTISFRELSGPVGIIGTVGSVVQPELAISEILLNLLYVSAFISINLGIMNLIPFPALDGSMLLILLIEKIRGKPLPQEKVGMISMVGFVLLICVLIITLFNDIPRWLM